MIPESIFCASCKIEHKTEIELATQYPLIKCWYVPKGEMILIDTRYYFMDRERVISEYDGKIWIQSVT